MILLRNSFLITQPKSYRLKIGLENKITQSVRKFHRVRAIHVTHKS